MFEPQRRGYFATVEVVLTFESGHTILVPDGEPVGADDDKDDVGIADGSFDVVLVPRPRFERIHISKDLVLAEVQDELVVESTDPALAIVTPVADYDA
jgi:hypothetical protein